MKLVTQGQTVSFRIRMKRMALRKGKLTKRTFLTRGTGVVMGRTTPGKVSVRITALRGKKSWLVVEDDFRQEVFLDDLDMP